MAEYLVEGIKTPYENVAKARAAAYRLVNEKPKKDVKIFKKIAPNTYSEMGYVQSMRQFKDGSDRVWFFSYDKNRWIQVYKNGTIGK